jgi:MutS domain V
MSVHDVLIQYENRLSDLHLSIVQLRLPHALTAALLAIAIGLFLVLILYAIRMQASYLLPSLPALIAAASAWRLQQHRQTKYRMWRLSRFYERSVQRVKGNWAGSGVTGEEFSPRDHVYAADLHLFGDGSLFELLCTARTSIGQRGLAKYLLEGPSIEQMQLRQDAVRELQGRMDLREGIATLGEFEFFESQWNTFEEWLGTPRLSFARSLPILALMSSTVLAGIAFAGLSAIIPWTTAAIWISPVITFHAAAGLFFRRRVNQMCEWVRPVSVETRVLGEGLRLLETEHFQSPKLMQLAGEVRNSSKSIRKLERLLDALAQRDKEWFYAPYRYFLIGTQLCMAIEQWRQEHAESLRIWLQAWGEFEALNALAAYGFENPANTFPEFADMGACFEAREMGHPLLSHTSCVANDVELNSSVPFYVISGSNMSGKSTLLRAIGLNAVLAFAGAPVRAGYLRLSDLSVVASMSIVDSLLNGKSKFLAEVDRLRQAIESAVENKSVLFLVDEIFGGTNSRDRRIAAEAVVRTLVKKGAIGALSTHDLALTEIAIADGMCGVNVHMGSRDERDPMDFDYQLKPGVTRESNALAIARLAGVPV